MHDPSKPDRPRAAPRGNEGKARCRTCGRKLTSNRYGAVMLPEGYCSATCAAPNITDVERGIGGPFRLKANGEQMMLEEVALEVLIDVLRSFGNLDEMVANCHQRMLPEHDEAWWRALFTRHLPGLLGPQEGE